MEVNTMNTLVCENCEQEVEALLPVTVIDYAMNYGSWCEACVDNYEPAN